MGLLVPAGCDRASDDCGYVAEGVSSWDDGFQALADADRAVDGSPYVALYGPKFKCSFQFESPAADGVPLIHTATVRVLSGSVEAAAVLFCRDSSTGERRLGRWWQLPADAVYRDLTETWAENPFLSRPWSIADLSGGRFRFGIARLPPYGPVRLTRMFLDDGVP